MHALEVYLGTICGRGRLIRSSRAEHLSVMLKWSVNVLMYSSTPNLACIASVPVLFATVSLPCTPTSVPLRIGICALTEECTQASISSEVAAI